MSLAHDNYQRLCIYRKLQLEEENVSHFKIASRGFKSMLQNSPVSGACSAGKGLLFNINIFTKTVMF